jgi:hypothetical protein
MNNVGYRPVSEVRLKKSVIVLIVTPAIAGSRKS